MSGGRRLRLVQLFPDLFNVYGDEGNVRALVGRAVARGIDVEVSPFRYQDPRLPAGDLYLIGGGQDSEQSTVGLELERGSAELRDALDGGASVLAVCAGYQNLGRAIQGLGGEIAGVGLLPVVTKGLGGDRLVGPILVHADGWLAALGAEGANAAGVPGAETTIVGFENHGGRTFLEEGGRPIGTVEIGHGNNGEDGSEGVSVRLASGSLRIGTYLHGPLLPRNPHVADALLAAALGHAGLDPELAQVDDTLEWRAHASFAERLRSSPTRAGGAAGWLRRRLEPLRNLAPF